MKLKQLTAVLATALTLFACHSNDTSELATLKRKISSDENEFKSPTDKMETDKEFYYKDSLRQKQPGVTDQKQQQPTDPVPKPDWDKKIIKSANLNAEVKEYAAFYTSIREKVKNLGGYIAQEEQVQSDYKIENSLVIKVPVDQFDNAMTELTANTQKINEKKINSSDVTGEMIDTRSRMEAKKQVRLRYLDLLKQAKNMEEILNVQSEINGIQEEIESAAGRMSFLGHSTTFSTIHFTYYQVLNQSAMNESNPGFGTKFRNAFKAGWSWIGGLAVGLVTIWPLLTLILIVIFIFRRARSARIKQA